MLDTTTRSQSALPGHRPGRIERPQTRPTRSAPAPIDCSAAPTNGRSATEHSPIAHDIPRPHRGLGQQLLRHGELTPGASLAHATRRQIKQEGRIEPLRGLRNRQVQGVAIGLRACREPGPIAIRAKTAAARRTTPGRCATVLPAFPPPIHTGCHQPRAAARRSGSPPAAVPGSRRPATGSDRSGPTASGAESASRRGNRPRVPDSRHLCR